MSYQVACCMVALIVGVRGEDGGKDACRFSETELEGGESCGCVYCVHDVKPDFREGFDPSLLVSFNCESDGLNDSFVGAFAGAIQFGVICC